MKFFECGAEPTEYWTCKFLKLFTCLSEFNFFLKSTIFGCAFTDEPDTVEVTTIVDRFSTFPLPGAFPSLIGCFPSGPKWGQDNKTCQPPQTSSVSRARLPRWRRQHRHFTPRNTHGTKDWHLLWSSAHCIGTESCYHRWRLMLALSRSMGIP